MKAATQIVPLMRDVVKRALQEMVKKERAIHLEEEKNIKGNGYYERNIGIPLGALEGPEGTRTRDGGFASALLRDPNRYLLEVGEKERITYCRGRS